MKRTILSCILLIAAGMQAQSAIFTDNAKWGFVPSTLEYDKMDKLGMSDLVVTYRMTFINDTTRRDKSIQDITQLLIGKNALKSRSYPLFQSDSISSNLFAKGARAAPTNQKSLFYEEITCDLTKNKMYVDYRMPLGVPPYTYIEDIPAIQWQLCDEKKTLFGYNCQKATCHFRGRDYIAWYTAEIPLKYGPYKFTGLPGLILAIADTAHEFVWDCIGIHKDSKKVIAKYWTRYGVRCDRAKARAALKLVHQNLVGYLTGSGMKVNLVDKNDQVKEMKSGGIPPIPFNPIEKE